MLVYLTHFGYWILVTRNLYDLDGWLTLKIMERYDYLLKFLIIGNAATGKTCLMRWFLEGKFKQDSLHTIGVEFGTKVLKVDSKSVKLQIWDTAGMLHLVNIISFRSGEIPVYHTLILSRCSLCVGSLRYH